MTVCNHPREAELPENDYRCTLPAGHDGEHQHHDGEAVSASWENDPGAEVLREIVAVINTRAKVLGLDTATLATRSGIDQVELGNILSGAASMDVEQLISLASAL